MISRASWLVILILLASLMPAGRAGAAQDPLPKIGNKKVTVIAKTGRQTSKDQQIGESTKSRTSGKAKDVEFHAPPVDWVTKERTCTGGGIDPACSATIIDCSTNPDASGQPRLVWMRQEGSDQWFGPIQTCLPGYPAPPDVNDPTIPRTSAPPPPVPTIAQIREAFLELPFAKPQVSMQPVGNRTLINLPTFYEASWPNDAGLTPGDVSTPVKLLSWTIQFKIAAKDYRYTFGEDSTSEWTASAGGVYPDGDITHTYETTGTRSVKVDARLVGQFRVNGGAWQDLGAVADLQDEPVAQLEVVGTKTRLVDN
ncbi:hypothetical protein [Janibacter alittae]|uniref:PKD domain-containing protein n=1 Tax=Janibacter alittae TaxID=3115209 RepID=A0ABZ2MKR5_9MICO